MKLSEFQKFMEKEAIDNVLLFNSSEKANSNFVYFTQVSQVSGALLINKNPTLYISSIEESIARKYSKVKNIHTFNRKFLDIVKDLKSKNIGIDKSSVTLNQFKLLKTKLKTKFVDVSQEILNLRLTKTEEEIDLLRKSCNYADELIRSTIELIKKSKTELEVVKLLQKAIIDKNLKPSFPPIIASSINSKNPHHISDNTKLKGFTIIDLGVIYKNYCSDTTRTVFIGKPGKEDILTYKKVLDSQESAISNDLSTKRLDESAKKSLGKYFTHSLGHGVGIDIHEMPAISSLAKDTKFKDNMVFTIEPGYYNKSGIRIEDVFLYKNNKKISLTKTSKNLLIL